MDLLIIWAICFGINILFTVFDALIVNKEFKATLGEIILLIAFMGILSPLGSLIYIIAYFAKYSEKTLINWKRKEK